MYSTTVVLLNESERSVKKATKDTSKKESEEKVYSNADILKAMMTKWKWFENILTVFTLMIICMSHLVNNFGNFIYDGSGGFIKCKPDDKYRWESQYTTGKFFGTFHVIYIMLSTIQAERVFYSIPHKIGYYDSQAVDKIKKKLMDSKISHELQ